MRLVLYLFPFFLWAMWHFLKQWRTNTHHNVLSAFVFPYSFISPFIHAFGSLPFSVFFFEPCDIFWSSDAQIHTTMYNNWTSTHLIRIDIKLDNRNEKTFQCFNYSTCSMFIILGTVIRKTRCYLFTYFLSFWCMFLFIWFNFVYSWHESNSNNACLCLHNYVHILSNDFRIVMVHIKNQNTKQLEFFSDSMIQHVSWMFNKVTMW